MNELALNLKLCYLAERISKGKALPVNVFQLLPGKAFLSLCNKGNITPQLLFSSYLL